MIRVGGHGERERGHLGSFPGVESADSSRGELGARTSWLGWAGGSGV